MAHQLAGFSVVKSVSAKYKSLKTMVPVLAVAVLPTAMYGRKLSALHAVSPVMSDPFCAHELPFQE